MSANALLALVGPHHHRQRVPADKALDPALQLLAAGKRRLTHGRNRILVGSGGGKREAIAGSRGVQFQLLQQASCPFCSAILQNVIQRIQPLPGLQDFLPYLLAMIGRIHSAVPLLCGLELPILQRSHARGNARRLETFAQNRFQSCAHRPSLRCCARGFAGGTSPFLHPGRNQGLVILMIFLNRQMKRAYDVVGRSPLSAAIALIAAPTSEGTEMFEHEIEMEKKEGSAFGPVIIILLLVGLFVGGIGVVVYQSRESLKPEQATAAIEAKLNSAPPVSITFHIGNVSYSAGDKPTDAQYKLFEKAGFIKIGKGKGYAAQVDLTSAGKQFLASLPDGKGVPEKDGTTGYTLQLASRKLVSVGKVAKLGQHKFQVQYTWAWQTTKAGELFDVAGNLVQSLPSYDRSMLIDQHGANYYHAAPAQATIQLVKDSNGLESTY